MAPAIKNDSAPSSPPQKTLSLGTALPYATRTALHLKGLVPSAVENFAAQEARAYEQFKAKGSPLEQYIFLSWLRNTNLNLFYRLVLKHLKEIAPVIYTPTVGQACQEFSHIYPFPGAALGCRRTIINNYKESIPEGQQPEITVITDGSRILGLGDLGMNGMGIPVGKLQLYVAAAGLDPTRCLPIVLDFGTDNSKYLEDPLYLGIRQKRPRIRRRFYAATEKVLNGLTRAFPEIFIQFEDFNTPHAFGLLEQWRNKILCFNDDIQGTGSVILSGFINAIRLAAGSAGVGVAKQLVDYLVIEHKIPEEQAKAMFWFVDSRGIINANRGDKLADHKIYFARHDNGDTQCKNLEEAIEYAFNEKILKRVNELNQKNRPIIFPLSNPQTKAECTFEEAMVATDNRVLFASGTAFPSYTIPGTDDTRVPGQGNNMYVFPPIGLGAKLAKPTSITDSLIFAVSVALSNTLTKEEVARGELYPRIERIRETSAQITAAFIHQAVREGLATDQYWVDLVKANPAPSATSEIPDGSYSQVVLDEVSKRMWAPAQSAEQFTTKL
ncbi:malic-domain-containing protein [Linderina pennispora]|uniref:Malic enzyme n=1 Tax=Linderina pennispora TaxID=61395 RepID=A0A1Y1VT06_9FUNG|nr:malic-domain-containing protein [Linderina pennispora]ORX64407.1 malic-domain-containing protein [Linderina pennispora]